MGPLSLDRELVVKVPGLPEPQGSMIARTVGRGPRARAFVVPSNDKALKPWRGRVAAGARALVDRYGGPYTGPLEVEVTLTCELPPSIRPERRLWPALKASGPGRGGDVDKLARAVLDGLTEGGIIRDDSQVVRLIATKVYPHTPDVQDRLDRPGAYIRLRPIT